MGCLFSWHTQTETASNKESVLCSLPRLHDKCSTLPGMVRARLGTRRGGTDVQSRDWPAGALVETETCSVGETLSIRIAMAI